MEQKKVRIDESSRQTMTDETRATQNMRLSQTHQRSMQMKDTLGSRMSGIQMTEKSSTATAQRTQILLDIQNSIQQLQSQMTSFEDKVEGKIQTLEDNHKELSGRLGAIEGK